MKRLIIDHVRRWWWVLAIAAIDSFGMGWASSADFSEQGHRKSLLLVELVAWLKTQNLTLVMSVFCLTVFSGAMLLQYDWQRGLIRAAVTLPLTARQLGRGWWLAAVAAPAGMMSALFFAGAAGFQMFHPHSVFPTGHLLLASLLACLWLGVNFNTYSSTAKSGWGRSESRRKKILNFGATGLMIWMVFGFAFSLNSQKNPYKWAVFICVGLILTILGWWRAEHFSLEQLRPVFPGRTRIRLKGGLTPLPIKYAAGRNPALSGAGGVPLLIGDAFKQSFLFCLITVVWFAVVFAFMGKMRGETISWSFVIEIAAGMAPAYWVISFFLLLPVVRQLRYLRTLPIAAHRLALTLMAMAILPLVAMGALIAGVAWLSTDTALTIRVLKDFETILAPAAWCIFYAVWRGTGALTYVVLILTFIGSRVEYYRAMTANPGQAATIAAAALVLAFLGIGYTLRRSSHAYRVPATPLVNFLGTGNK